MVCGGLEVVSDDVVVAMLFFADEVDDAAAHVPEEAEISVLAVGTEDENVAADSG